MSTDHGSDDFLLIIDAVFMLPGRGLVVVGMVESGVLRNDDDVEVWDEAHLITRARATVDLVCRPTGDGRTVGLRLHDVDRELLAPGQTVRCPRSTP